MSGWDLLHHVCDGALDDSYLGAVCQQDLFAPLLARGVQQITEAVMDEYKALQNYHNVYFLKLK